MQDSQYHIFGQMIQVLRVGPELLPADDAADHHNAVAALGDRWRVFNELSQE